MMKLFLLLSINFFLSVSSGIAQPNVRLSKLQLQKLDSIVLQDVPPRAPGVATAIIQNGEIIYQKYAGYADLTDSTFITNQSRFNIASNGKQFTALAVLTLIDEKKLKLSDDIRKWFPTLFPKMRERITIENLLTHTSGIRDCYDLWSLQGLTWWKNSFTNADVLALIEAQEDLNFAPGSQYLYSNTNYIVLALIIEKVSGRSFVEYTSIMFNKLNMHNTSFVDDYTKIQGPIARSYFNFGTWTTYSWIWNVCGDGNIFSTLADQIQWERVVQGKVKTSMKRNVILQSQQIIEGSAFKSYGYGLEFGTYKGLEYVFHEGATGAWKATVLRFPETNISMITLTNTGKSIPYTQTRQMADVIFNKKTDAAYLVTEPTAIGKFVAVDDVVGTYLTESDFMFQFEKREDKLFLKRNGRNDVELEREADNIFRQKFDPAFKQEFTTNAQGEMQVTAYYINHAPYTLTRPAVNWNGFDARVLEGNYFNTETKTLLEIKVNNDKTYDINFGSKSSRKGFLISPFKLLIDPYSVEIESVGNSIDTLYLNGDRIKKVKFVRQL
jgi:CubicO group peptidase (beta-lactamase class C family)